MLKIEDAKYKIDDIISNGNFTIRVTNIKISIDSGFFKAILYEGRVLNKQNLDRKILFKMGEMLEEDVKYIEGN